jgi:hypothetical protein
METAYFGWLDKKTQKSKDLILMVVKIILEISETVALKSATWIKMKNGDTLHQYMGWLDIKTQKG